VGRVLLHQIKPGYSAEHVEQAVGRDQVAREPSHTRYVCVCERERILISVCLKYSVAARMCALLVDSQPALPIIPTTYHMHSPLYQLHTHTRTHHALPTKYHALHTMRIISYTLLHTHTLYSIHRRHDVAVTRRFPGLAAAVQIMLAIQVEGICAVTMACMCMCVYVHVCVCACVCMCVCMCT
jgi:hypothetical protein